MGWQKDWLDLIVKTARVTGIDVPALLPAPTR
jgi:hypothetical protein